MVSRIIEFLDNYLVKSGRQNIDPQKIKVRWILLVGLI